VTTAYVESFASVEVRGSVFPFVHLPTAFNVDRKSDFTAAEKDLKLGFTQTPVSMSLLFLLLLSSSASVVLKMEFT
jgi:hypothetical protein